MKRLRTERQSEQLKEMCVHRLTLLESVSSPGSSHKADVDSMQRRLSACRGCSVCLSGPAAPDQCEEPSEGQVQQTARGYGTRIQTFNYSDVGYGAGFFFTFR